MLEEELQEHPELLDVPDLHGRTPLFWSISRDNIRAMETLLQRGANIRIFDNSGVSILHRVVSALPGDDSRDSDSDSWAL